MRFFKTEQPMSWEDETAAVRLQAIATRTRAGQSPAADEASAEQAEAEPQPKLRDALQ